MIKRLSDAPRSNVSALPAVLGPAVTAAIAGLAVLMATGGAAAGSYPDKPIRMISPFSAGSPPDAFGRLIAEQLSSKLGQSVVIENKPGAGTTLGTKAGAAAEPDGYTLLQVNASLGYTPALYPHAGYDPVKSFAPVAMLASFTHVLVSHPSVPANSMRELVAYAKSNPGKLSIGFPLGSSPHILAEMFKAQVGADINSVPYRQAPLLVSDVVAGRVQLYFSTGEPIFSMIRNGKLRAYAFTAKARDAGFPDIPTMAEAGLPDMTVDPSDWIGILAPAGTPPAVVAKLNEAINDVLGSPQTHAVRTKLGWRAAKTTPEQFAGFVSAAVEKWPPIVRAIGLKGE